MSKRVAVKVAVTVAAVCAMTVLPGCVGEQDSTVLSSAWTPAGFPWTLVNYFGYDQSVTGGASQGTTTTGSGGQTVSSAISSGMGGSGGQVSGGAGF
jgi:hypothetical protein